METRKTKDPKLNLGQQFPSREAHVLTFSASIHIIKIMEGKLTNITRNADKQNQITKYWNFKKRTENSTGREF